MVSRVSMVITCLSHAEEVCHGKSPACCRDVGLDCEGEIRAETEEEILRQAAEHARTTHNMGEMAPEMVQKVRAAIRDE